MVRLVHPGQRIDMRGRNIRYSQMWASSPRSQARRWGQIAQFGVASGGHLGDQVAAHSGGSVRVPFDLRSY
jgi:hypothetical protein